MRRNSKNALMDVVPKTVGARLTVAFLIRRDMSQRQLAVDLGVNQAQLNRYIRGQTKISVEAAVKIEAWSGGNIPVSSWTVPFEEPAGTDVTKSKGRRKKAQKKESRHER